MDNRIKATVLGHAVADALGVPVEFDDRAKLKQAPVTDMEGYGTYNMPEGCWSDDTSMAIAALDSLKKGGVDWQEIMENFCKWYYKDEYTPTGVLFDAGGTCIAAIQAFNGGARPLESGLTLERSNGNGSLMRIYPFVLYQYYLGNKDIDMIHKASMLTHAHLRSQLGCGIYALVMWELMGQQSKDAVLRGIKKARELYAGTDEAEAYLRIFNWGEGEDLCDEGEIKSSGYVVDTLEAALWSLLKSDSYASAVLCAVNLGDNTDTVGAVTGALAGILYGYEGIPAQWLKKLKKREYLESMCDEAYKNWQ